MATCAVFILKPKLGRMMYVGLLLFGTLVSLAAFSARFRNFFVQHSHWCDRNLSHKKCDLLAGHMLLFRVFIGLLLFFLFLAVVNCQVTLFTTFGNWLENGLWLIKFHLLFLLILLSLLIPEGHVGNLIMHIGWVGAFIIMVIQLVLIIDFGRTWNVYWVEKMELSLNPSVWYFSLLFVTSMLYTFSIIFIVYFYATYGNPLGTCKTNLIFMSTAVLLCLCASLLSIHPRIRETGLLQAGLVTSYATYLMWMSLRHNPQPQCNPTWSYMTSEEFSFHFQPSAFFDISLTFALLVYGVIRVGSVHQILSALNLIDCCIPHEERIAEENHSQNEERLLISSYLLFYLLLLLVCLHILMTLSNFYTPEGILGTDNELIVSEQGLVDMEEYLKVLSQWVASCLKMTVCILFVLFYIWTIVSPVLFSNN